MMPETALFNKILIVETLWCATGCYDAGNVHERYGAMDSIRARWICKITLLKRRKQLCGEFRNGELD